MKKTLREQVIDLLKTGWYSNFQINMFLRSSSADREMRRIRENPPIGYVVNQREKQTPKELGYRWCLEYTLKEVVNE